MPKPTSPPTNPCASCTHFAASAAGAPILVGGKGYCEWHCRWLAPEHPPCWHYEQRNGQVAAWLRTMKALVGAS